MAGYSKDSDDSGSELWRLSGLGMEFASAIAVGGLAGWLFDRWQGTQPNGVLVGLVVGIVGGGFNLIRQAMAANKRATERFRRKHPDGLNKEEDD